MHHSTFITQMPLVISLFKANKIKSACIFGSIASDNFDDQSDIDLLINFEDNMEPLEKGKM